MKPDHFTSLADLALPDLQQRRADAERLLDQARQHQAEVEQQVADTAPARLVSGHAADYSEAECALRVAALRVSDAQRVLAAVGVAIGAAQDRATAEADHRALLADLPARRERLQAELERAQAAWAEANVLFDGPGSWCSIELPHNLGRKAKLTLIGETRWSVVRGAHEDCQRIKQELAGLDALEQGEQAREAA